MRTISRYPIFPSPLMMINVPAGAQLLSVFEDMGTYYVDVLAEPGPAYDKVGICAYMDNSPIPDGDKNIYLGSLFQVGTGARLHFFEFGGAL